MRITLLFPPENFNYKLGIIDVISDNWGKFPPLSLLYVASYLNANDHKCQIIDANANKLTIDEICKQIKEFETDIIGCSVHCLSYSSQIPFYEIIAKKTKKDIFVGGIDIKHYAKEVMNYKFINYAIMGDAVDTLAFINALESNTNLDKINGLVYRENNNLKINNYVRNDANKLCFSKFIDWSLIDLNNYYSMITTKKYASIFTSFGCPFSCIFCSEGKSKVYNRPINEIMNELEQLENLGANYVEILDSTFTLNRKRAIKICEEISKRNFRFKLGIETRVDKLDKEFIQWLKKANVERVNLGIETADKKIQRFIKKEIDLDKTKDMIKELNRLKITTLGYFIFGHPLENKFTMQKTIKFAKETDLTFAFFSKIVPYEGTELYEYYKNTYGDYWKEQFFIQDKNELKFVKNRLNNHTIDKYINKAYREFYLRPKQILKIILRANSPFNILKYAKVGLIFIFNILKKN